MTDEARDVFFAGIIEARGRAYVNSRRPHLEVMLRDLDTAEALRAHFGGVGKLTVETPKYRRDVRNYVYRVQGGAALDVLERVTPYLVGYSAEACASVLERCGRSAT
jgi:hypothetical protein